MQAWLAITPKESEQTNQQAYGGELPDIPYELGHIPEMLQEIGCAGSGFERLVPLTFTEIKSWGELMQMNLTIFEADAIHRMSVAYVSIANNTESECPIKSDDVLAKKNTVNASAWSSLGKRS